MKPRLHVIAVGGGHQLLHILPVAAEIHRRGKADVTIFADDAPSCRAVADGMAILGIDIPAPRPLPLPRWLQTMLPRKWHKGLRLLLHGRCLRRCDAILTAERTSTMLRRLPGRSPLFLHIPHGAGDRAKGFEKRIALFDHVMVAGPKDRDRMIAAGLVQAERCHVIGPVKVGALAARAAKQPRLFTNDRPMVLYNPHFDARLGSFAACAERLLDQMAAQDTYNFILAPHVRLAENWDAQRRAAFEAKSVPGKVIVDMGSARSSDMTYVQAADLYLGDVSSQVYEFLVRPRPCLFIDCHQAPWRDDLSYVMWHFGPVAAPDSDLMAMIGAAFASHADFIECQRAGVAAALGTDPAGGVLDPAARAADLIEGLLMPAIEG